MAHKSQVAAATTSPPQAGDGHRDSVQYLGFWIQYKGLRARTMQTSKDTSNRARLAPNILDQFQADLEELAIFMPGISPTDVKIVWGTGQIRATYNLHPSERHDCEILKYLVKRATSNGKLLELRSIAHIIYVENGSPVEIDKSLTLPSASTSSYPPSHSRLYPDHSPELPHGFLGSKPLAVSYRGGSSRTNSFRSPTTSSPSTPYGTLRSQPPGGRQPPISLTSRPPPAPAPVSAPSAPALTSFYDSTHSTVSSVIQHFPATPQILPPMFFGKEGVSKSPREMHGMSFSTGDSDRVQHSSQASARQNEFGAQDVSRLRLPHASVTLGACARLRNRTDSAILSEHPIVRILVLRTTISKPAKEDVKAFEAFVADGESYAWLACSSSLSECIGNRDDKTNLQVGSLVRLKTMSRLLDAGPCLILVHEFDLVDSYMDTRSRLEQIGLPTTRSQDVSMTGSGSTMVTAHQNAVGSSPETSLIQTERAARLLAEMKLQEERRRRIALERALEGVCHDIERRDVLVPAVLDALRQLDEVADLAMPID